MAATHVGVAFRSAFLALLLLVPQLAGAQAPTGTSLPPGPLVVTGSSTMYPLMTDIARRFEVTIHELQAWNNMGRSTSLRAGQSLTIHVGGGANVGG